MYKEEYDLLIYKLNQMFYGNVTIKYQQALSDDDFESGYAVIYDGVIVGNPDLGFEYNAMQIYSYLMNKFSTKEGK